MSKRAIVVVVLAVALFVGAACWVSCGASDLWSSFVGVFTDADAPDHRIEGQRVGEWKNQIPFPGTDSPKQPGELPRRLPRIQARQMMKTPDGGSVPLVEPPTLDQRIASACARISTTASSGDLSISAINRVGDELREMLGAWAMDESLDTLLLAGCGLSSEKAAAIFTAASIREPPKDAVDRWCWLGSLYPQLGKPPWTKHDRNRWYARCKELVAPVPETPPAPQLKPRPPDPPPPAGPDPESHEGGKEEAAKVCPAFHAVAAKYEAIVSGKANGQDIVDYGRGLATCGPSENPWDVFSVVEGRPGFVRTYVLPYILRMDARAGDPVTYAKVAHAWKFD